MQAVHHAITTDVYDVLSASASVKSRVSEGGTAPRLVRLQAKRWIKKLTENTRRSYDTNDIFDHAGFAFRGMWQALSARYACQL